MQGRARKMGTKELDAEAKGAQAIWADWDCKVFVPKEVDVKGSETFTLTCSMISSLRLLAPTFAFHPFHPFHLPHTLLLY